MGDVVNFRAKLTEISADLIGGEFELIRPYRWIV
jgi:hypothetical protein